MRVKRQCLCACSLFLKHPSTRHIGTLARRRPPPTKPSLCCQEKRSCVKDAAGLRPRLHSVQMTSRWEAKQGVSGGDGETCRRTRSRPYTVTDHTTRRGGCHQENSLMKAKQRWHARTESSRKASRPRTPGHHPKPLTQLQCYLPPTPRPPLSETSSHIDAHAHERFPPQHGAPVRSETRVAGTSTTGRRC